MQSRQQPPESPKQSNIKKRKALEGKKKKEKTYTQPPLYQPSHKTQAHTWVRISLAISDILKCYLWTPSLTDFGE